MAVLLVRQHANGDHHLIQAVGGTRQYKSGHTLTVSTVRGVPALWTVVMNSIW
ncbi:hypothetical protein HHL19_11350 [Streptomyces sp. R302]|uniref:hypothetical protein n=1 Tax=unclassified Streptomyces TaxID=2593676 RepID=UPI00145D1259|nr:MULTISPECIES: hypothetical protein [unclassified Streptomyces]NML50259.1 hypothetical protein [Streptomyces sp. R301]NML79250.1 hypothetical protein [Streptomyces sp. R302]